MVASQVRQAADSASRSLSGYERCAGFGARKRIPSRNCYATTVMLKSNSIVGI